MPLAIDYDIERERQKRRRAIAEAQLAESMKPSMEGMQAAPGGIVPKYAGSLSALSKVAQAYFADQQLQGVKADEDKLGQDVRSETSQALSRYQRAVTPRAAVAGALNEDASGNVYRTDDQPAYTPGMAEKQGAAYELLGATGGDPRDVAKMVVASALKGPEIGKLEPKDYTPESWAAYSKSGDTSLLRAAPKYHNVGNALVPEPTGGSPAKPAYQADPEAIRTLKAAGLVEGTPEWDTAMKDLVEKTTKHAPAPTAIATASTEKGYGAHFAGKIADQDASMLDAARKAPELAERANRVKQVLASGKVITGTGADVRLQIGKALNLAGASDAEVVANTEILATDLARNTLDAIKGSGLGSGSGFSNADRDFLEKAVGGKITLEPQTLSRLADLSHRAAALSAESWNKRVKDIPDSALQGTGIKRDAISVQPLHGAKAGPQVSPETQRLLDKYAPEGR